MSTTLVMTERCTSRPLSYSGQDEDSFPTFDHPTHDMVSVKDSPFGAKGDGTTDDTLVRKQRLYCAKTES